MRAGAPLRTLPLPTRLSRLVLPPVIPGVTCTEPAGSATSLLLFFRFVLMGKVRTTNPSRA
jgi:hypothetical protein